jgi:NTP pyrophosphatase (non-canonical NTP hydrolase)
VKLSGKLRDCYWHVKRKAGSRYGLNINQRQFVHMLEQVVDEGKHTILEGMSKRPDYEVHLVQLDGMALPVVFDKELRTLATVLPRGWMIDMISKPETKQRMRGNMPERKEILAENVTRNGPLIQMLKLAEECSELAAAITRRLADSRRECRRDIAQLSEAMYEEAADVRLMIEQLEMLTPDSGPRIKYWEDVKLARMNEENEKTRAEAAGRKG